MDTDGNKERGVYMKMYKNTNEEKSRARQKFILQLVENPVQNRAGKLHFLSPSSSLSERNLKIKTQRKESKSFEKDPLKTAPRVTRFKYDFNKETSKSHDFVQEPSESSASTEIPVHENEEKDLTKKKINEAVKEQKMFLIRANIPYLEESLKKRGWLPKYESTKTRLLPYGSVSSIETSSLADINSPENAFEFQELKNVAPNFIWDCRNDFITWKPDIKPETILNRLQKSIIYCSKLGMAKILEESHWHFENEVSEVLFPRSYNASRDENAFIEDYRRTATVGMLKCFIEQYEDSNLENKAGTFSTAPKQIEFALKRCKEILATVSEDDLDSPENAEVPFKDWHDFLEDYVRFVHEDCGLSEADKNELSVLYEASKSVLEMMKEVDPQFHLNGMRNVWILKPNTTCCGNGIAMTHKLDLILKKISSGPKDYFLIQKYIEKPLLIKNTKFDVRHWYLVTNSYPLTIWIYKESLIRFSSRPFTFVNYHEVIHICNTAVQSKYTDAKNPVRSLNWNCEMINQYLKEELGLEGDPWYEKIYPKMCQAIVGTMLGAQDKMDRRKNSFELYGADFVIMDDLSVWLIEVNSNPRTHPPSSNVTERLYPDVLESLVKVVLDYPKNPEADTGNFVLAYKQNTTSFRSYMETSMLLKGTAVSTQ